MSESLQVALIGSVSTIAAALITTATAFITARVQGINIGGSGEVPGTITPGDQKTGSLPSRKRRVSHIFILRMVLVFCVVFVASCVLLSTPQSTQNGPEDAGVSGIHPTVSNDRPPLPKPTPNPGLRQFSEVGLPGKEFIPSAALVLGEGCTASIPPDQIVNLVLEVHAGGETYQLSATEGSFWLRTSKDGVSSRFWLVQDAGSPEAGLYGIGSNKEGLEIGGRLTRSFAFAFHPGVVKNIEIRKPLANGTDEAGLPGKGFIPSAELVLGEGCTASIPPDQIVNLVLEVHAGGETYQLSATEGSFWLRTSKDGVSSRFWLVQDAGSPEAGLYGIGSNKEGLEIGGRLTRSFAFAFHPGVVKKIEIRKN